MRHLGRSALLVTVLCALAAAGCSSSADSPSQPVVKNDPAFAAAKLRAIDPCGLLDQNTLHPQGEPAGNADTFVGEPSGLDNCTVHMQTFHHSDLSVGVMVGAETSTVGSRTVISGMAVMEEENPDECDDLILTQDPKIGIMVQIQTHYSPCVTGRQVTTAMIDHIRTDPPKRQTSAGSLSALDPCDTVDGSTAAATVGPAPTENRKTLYTCDWDDGPLDLAVAFWVGDARVPNYGQATPQPVDLGGVTGYQVLPDKQSCEIGWNARPAGAPHQFEVVYVEVGNLGTQPVDTCAKTLPAAKAVLTKVAKAS